jgi:TDG/mug DNA glycosylase family protein
MPASARRTCPGDAVRRDELEQYRGAPVDDLVGPGLRLLLVGINPGLWTAAVNAHFARPGNRFWPALYRAGIVERLIDASRGLLPGDADLLLARGVGITNIVNVATARADELTSEQLRDGARRLEALVRTTGPRVVGVLGLTAYRQAFGRPRAVAGRQPEDLAGAELWVAPNPSGLNAHASLASLAADYRELAVRAGVPVGPPVD